MMMIYNNYVTTTVSVPVIFVIWSILIISKEWGVVIKLMNKFDKLTGDWSCYEQWWVDNGM